MGRGGWGAVGGAERSTEAVRHPLSIDLSVDLLRLRSGARPRPLPTALLASGSGALITFWKACGDRPLLNVKECVMWVRSERVEHVALDASRLAPEACHVEISSIRTFRSNRQSVLTNTTKYCYRTKS